MSRLTRDWTAEPVSRDQISRHERGQGNINFLVQLTTTRSGNLTRLTHTLAIFVIIHTYIHTYIHAGRSASAFFSAPTSRPTLIRAEIETLQAFLKFYRVARLLRCSEVHRRKRLFAIATRSAPKPSPSTSLLSGFTVSECFHPFRYVRVEAGPGRRESSCYGPRQKHGQGRVWPRQQNVAVRYCSVPICIDLSPFFLQPRQVNHPGICLAA